MAETTTETTQAQTAETKPAEPSKTEVRRQKEKELRAAQKPDYRTPGTTLKILKGNPKKPGSNAHVVYGQYKDGAKTTDILGLELTNAKGEVISKSYIGACLMWDARHGFIELVAPAKPEVKAAEPATAQPAA